MFDIQGKIVYKFLRTARKSHTCEMCGKEIHQGEHIWYYKPKPLYNFYRKTKQYFSWRKRCYDCTPLSYSELDLIQATIERRF